MDDGWMGRRIKGGRRARQWMQHGVYKSSMERQPEMDETCSLKERGWINTWKRSYTTYCDLSILILC